MIEKIDYHINHKICTLPNSESFVASTNLVCLGQLDSLVCLLYDAIKYDDRSLITLNYISHSLTIYNKDLDKYLPEGSPESIEIIKWVLKEENIPMIDSTTVDYKRLRRRIREYGVLKNRYKELGIYEAMKDKFPVLNGLWEEYSRFANSYLYKLAATLYPTKGEALDSVTQALNDMGGVFYHLSADPLMMLRTNLLRLLDWGRCEKLPKTVLDSFQIQHNKVIDWEVDPENHKILPRLWVEFPEPIKLPSGDVLMGFFINNEGIIYSGGLFYLIPWVESSTGEEFKFHTTVLAHLPVKGKDYITRSLELIQKKSEMSDEELKKFFDRYEEPDRIYIINLCIKSLIYISDNYYK